MKLKIYGPYVNVIHIKDSNLYGKIYSFENKLPQFGFSSTRGHKKLGYKDLRNFFVNHFVFSTGDKNALRKSPTFHTPKRYILLK